MIHTWNKLEMNQKATVLINSSTFLGCLHSKDGVQFSHLSLPSSMHLLSRPKPDTRICDHDRHANIKPKPDINKNQLSFFQNFYKSFPLSFHSCFFT